MHGNCFSVVELNICRCVLYYLAHSACDSVPCKGPETRSQNAGRRPGLLLPNVTYPGANFAILQLTLALPVTASFVFTGSMPMPLQVQCLPSYIALHSFVGVG